MKYVYRPVRTNLTLLYCKFGRMKTLPRTQPVRSLQRTKAAKTLCIIDTCSLVYMDRVKLVRKPLQNWLWEEFDVKYSEAVFDELMPFTAKLSTQRNWEKDVWRVPILSNYEAAIFSLHQRQAEGIYCSHCRQRTWKYEMFRPDLTESKDRGERYNCCLALHSIVEGSYSQVIFLTDDLRSRHDYTTYFFDVFPLGTVWSLLDLITYLFVRYWKHIPLQGAKEALRDANAANTKLVRTGERGQQDERIQYEESEKKTQRLQTYYNKVERIHQMFSQV